MGTGNIAGIFRRAVGVNPAVPLMAAPLAGGLVAYAAATHHDPTSLGTTLSKNPALAVMAPFVAWGLMLTTIASHRARVATYAVDGAEQIVKGWRPFDGATVPSIINAVGGATVGLAIGTETRQRQVWQEQRAAQLARDSAPMQP